LHSTYFPIEDETLRRTRLIWYVATLLLLLYGIRGLWPLRSDIGQTYAGVPVLWYSAGGYVINGEVPWSWPGPQNGLRGRDQVLRMDGKDPYYFFKEAFRNKEPGDTVKFDVMRGDQLVQASVPVTIFTFERFFEFYGFWFLAGVSCLLAGILLVRSAADESRIVLALTFMVVAAVFFVHGYTGFIHFYRYSFDLLTEIVWHYGYLLIGALLYQFALVFPHPPAWLERHPRLRFIPLYWAFLLGTLYLVGGVWFFDNRTNSLTLNLVLLTISTGAIVVILRPIWSYFHPGPEGRGWAIMLGSVWAMGVILLLGVGVLPFVAHGGMMILTEVLLPLCVVYPFMLVYAVYNVDLIERLQREMKLKEQYADEVTELRGIRERTLHELADELHNTVVPDVRGLQLWIGPLQRRLRSYLDPHEASKLVFMTRALNKMHLDSRRIMEEAKPVNFADEGLTQPLRRLIVQADAAGWWNQEIAFSADPGADDLDPAIAEDVYWIVRTALNICREHADATQVTVQVRCSQNTLHVTVSAVRHGSLPDEASKQAAGTPSHHLGIRNMEMRARRLNGDIEYTNHPQLGATIHLIAPLEERANVVSNQTGYC